MYETSSLPLAAFLVVRGHPLVETRKNGPVVHFIFEEVARQAATEFYSGTQVDPAAYSSASRELARALREVMRRG